jgi:hypothetical protein
MRLVLLLLLSPSALTQEWVTLDPVKLDGAADPATITRESDGSLRVTGGPDVQRYELSFLTDLDGITALRIEGLPDGALPMKGPGRAKNGNFVLGEVRLASRVGRTRRDVELAHASASFSQVGWPILAAIDGRDETGWAVHGSQGKRVEAVFNLAEPLGKGRRTLTLELIFAFGQQHTLGRLRVAVTNAAGDVSAAGVNAGLTHLERAVNEAVGRGVGYISDQQDLDGSWAGDRNHYRVGGTALNAYALVKSGMRPAHQVLRRALAYIDANPPQKTYEAGCVLLLYAALDHETYRDRAQTVLEDLLDWQVGDWGYPGGHNNPSAGHVDLSNTQYGALGYWAASKMGLSVPPTAWRRLAEATLRYQRPGGGFGYTPGAGPKGSMSAAGTAVLALCVPHLEGGTLREAEVGLEKGIAWLDSSFKPTENTGAGRSWLLYYLYGIERVGAFADRKKLNSMDWYTEGARLLLKEQKGKGEWHGDGRVLANTSFALLFLNRASASVTGPGVARGKHTYGADDPAVNVNLRAAGDTPLTMWISSFGDVLLDGYTFEGERDLGPRVVKVDYLTRGGVVLSDSRRGGGEWTYTEREPVPGWQRPVTTLKKGWKKGLGGFGRKDSPQVAVRTSWEKDELWLAHDLDLDPASLVEPRLEVSFSSSAGVAELGPQEPLLKLYDEEADFVGRLREGGAKIEQVKGGASGEHALQVAAVQRFSAKIPGWDFKIREKPEQGEYRYLRFRWRKPKGGVMVQFAFSGTWSLRYHSGPNTLNWNPSIEVDDETPEEWVTVTRDLWADTGDARMTGIALTAMAGQAYFDGIYLARKKADLRREPDLAVGVPEWDPAAAGAFAGADALVIEVNGERVAALDRETVGFQTVLEGEALRGVLRKGTNRIALHARNNDLGRALDLGIVDDRRLATIAGKPDQPSNEERFAARVSFPRPADYPVWARVTLLDGTDSQEVTFDSPVLTAHVQEAFDPALVEYASDAGRNLLLDGEVSVTASTEFPNWPATRAVDGRYDLAWLSADGDEVPSIEFQLRRPVKADTVLLSHTRVDRHDAGRTTLPTRVAVTLNGKGDPIVVDLEPSRLRKTAVPLGQGTKVRSFTVQVVDRSEGKHPVKTAVGFAEVELHLRGR